MTDTHKQLVANYYSDKTLDKAFYTALSYLTYITTLIVFTSITINKIINKSTEPVSQIEQIIVLTLLTTNVAILLIPRLKDLRKEQWKDLLFEETKNLAKRYYDYLIKKEKLIIQLKKIGLNMISSLCIIFDIWVLYKTLIKNQPIPINLLDPNSENFPILHVILMFTINILIVIAIIEVKNEIATKYKEKIQTLPQTFEGKYGINPIN